MKLSDVKSGDCLITDLGFTCVEAGPVIVEGDEGLFFPCRHGCHYLIGQLDDDGVLVGLNHG